MCRGGITPPTQEVGCAIVLGVRRSGTDVIVRVLMLSRMYCVIGNVCGLLMGLIPVVSKIIIENRRS